MKKGCIKTYPDTTFSYGAPEETRTPDLLIRSQKVTV